MPISRFQPHIIEHPINPDSVENMNTMFQELYEDLAVASVGTPPLVVDEGDVVIGGDEGVPEGLPLGVAGQLLISGNDRPEWTGFTIPNTLVQGDLFYGSALDTVGLLNKSTLATRYLSNTGASNAPAWAQVALATGVTGTLPFANGGTGIIAVSTGDILIASGGVLARLAAAAPAGGFLRSSGAGAAPTWGLIQFPNSITTGSLLHATAADVINALAAGSAGKVLTAHGPGVALTWETPAAGSVPHALLDGVTISDSIAQAVTRGSLIIGNATPKWDELLIGAAATVLTSDGVDAAWAVPAVTPGSVAADIASAIVPLATSAAVASDIAAAVAPLADSATVTADIAAAIAPLADAATVTSDIAAAIAPLATSAAVAAAIAAEYPIDLPTEVTGDLPDANLSANVPLLNATNAFTGANSFATNPLSLLIGQLLFPATQNASSDVNTLDDYEEGTFTPVLTGVASNHTYSVQVGVYVKIGQLVYINGRITLSSKGTTTGSCNMGGFPFVSLNVTNAWQIASPVYFTGLSVAHIALPAYLPPNASGCAMISVTAAATSQALSLNWTSLGNATDIIFGLTYRANA